MLGKKHVSSKGGDEAAMAGINCVGLISFVFSLVLSSMNEHASTQAFSIVVAFIFAFLLTIFNPDEK